MHLLYKNPLSVSHILEIWKHKKKQYLFLGICNKQVKHVVCTFTKNVSLQDLYIFPPAASKVLLDYSQRPLITATSSDNCSKAKSPYSAGIWQKDASGICLRCSCITKIIAILPDFQHSHGLIRRCLSHDWLRECDKEGVRTKDLLKNKSKKAKINTNH